MPPVERGHAGYGKTGVSTITDRYLLHVTCATERYVERTSFWPRPGGVFAAAAGTSGSGFLLFGPTGQQQDVAAHRRDMDEEDAVSVEHVVEALAARIGQSFRPDYEQFSQLFNDVLGILPQIFNGQLCRSIAASCLLTLTPTIFTPTHSFDASIYMITIPAA